jgi:hypothetical protein
MRWSRKRTRSALGSKLCKSSNLAVAIGIAALEFTKENLPFGFGRIEKRIVAPESTKRRVSRKDTFPKKKI